MAGRDAEWQEEQGRRKAEKLERLGKRVTYLLRYGALKEGLTVHAGGYVDIKSMLGIPMMSHTSQEELADLVMGSVSSRGVARYETKTANGALYARPCHRQQMERSPYHEGSKVTRLLERCICFICSNVTIYDLEGFPDVYLLNTIIHKLKRDKQLTNKALHTVLAPSMDQLSLQGVYLTANSLRIVGNQCPYLRVLNLHGHGYILTDHYMEQLFKKLRCLESLNLSSCHHLTDRTLVALATCNQGLVHFVGSGNQLYSEGGLLDLLIACTKLSHLDVFDNPNVTDAGRTAMVDIGRQRDLTIILKGLTDKTVAPTDMAMVPCVWTVTTI